jgi:hypothetical protein
MMARILTKLRIDEVSAVIKGSNPGAKVMIMKSDDDPPYLFNDIMLAKASVSDPLRGPRDEDDDDKLSAKLRAMVAAMTIADPSKTEQQHLHYLLHSAHGRRLAEHFNNLSKGEPPMLDVNKLIPIAEKALMASVNKRDDESDAKAFTRKFENDLEFRKQWKIVQEARHLLSPNMTKSVNVMDTTPTSTEVGNTSVPDDSAEAIRLLRELAEKQHRTFEEVFADPNNKALAGRTYTSHHRPNVSSTSGSELQR